jgi:hypothetical protein
VAEVWLKLSGDYLLLRFFYFLGIFKIGLRGDRFTAEMHCNTYLVEFLELELVAATVDSYT